MSELRLHIVDVQTGWSEEVQFSDEEQELLSMQLDRFCGMGTPEAFSRWLANTLATAIPDAVDYDLRPPTPAQVAYATGIARGLGLPLSPQVLRYRGPMHEFLSTYKEAFEQRPGKRRRGRQAPAD